MDKLGRLRKKIDDLDEQLLNILHERLEVVRQVGVVKKELKLPPLDRLRWGAILEKAFNKAESLGMRREFVKTILDTIHEEALQIERKT